MVLLREERLEASAGVKPVRIPLELILDALKRSHVILLLLGTLGCWACRLLNFTGLLHEFVKHIVLEYRVVQEFEIFKVLHCILLARTADRLRQKSSRVPRHL